MTTPKPVILLLVTFLLLAGCATQGPTRLYLAGDAEAAVQQIDLSANTTSDYEQVPLPGTEVIGLGYEFNTDYVWLRMAPGDRLVAIKRFEEEFWYDYQLPESFQVPEEASGDIAVRAFNRMIYLALAEGRVARVTRYGEVLDFRRISEDRQIGGLAWDQVEDQLLVLWADGEEVSRYDLKLNLIETVTLAAPLNPQSLAYDSNNARFLVPLAGGQEVGEFDRGGTLTGRYTMPEGMRALDAGQMSAIRVF